ncbi:hypothetical protein C8R26_11845 [Nitrosomonas oligotropha]|jgi:hypothetical protein|uniref:Uncharacterized protein n=1 Tax=Nitrosomonas oligotropha TaxID=42354 RepID=A0A2T5HXT7_9PROT|nr:hypothetical protein [Nitrosomonas oligotropha]PTQ76389.1 hypothetical protein C8R26_11845 [Nitrosomonas oligotropha]
MDTWAGEDKDINGGVDTNVDEGRGWRSKIWKMQINLEKHRSFITNKLNIFFTGAGGAILIGLVGVMITALAISILLVNFYHGKIVFSVPLILMLISGPFAIVLFFRWDRLS